MKEKYKILKEIKMIKMIKFGKSLNFFRIIIKMIKKNFPIYQNFFWLNSHYFLDLI